MKKILLILCALLLTAVGASAQITDGSYMVVNTETGQFLYGSYNWGCRASLGTKPVFFTVTSTGENTYTLSSQQWTATRYLYLSGTDFYCDTSTSTNITVTETETGSGIYTISYNGSYMLQSGKNAGTTSTTDASAASHWQFVSLQDVIDSMEGASSANPVDVTALINDANFKPNGNGLTATNNWTQTGVTIGKYENNATTACCAEGYNESSFSISQTISLPKAGYYNLSAQGFYRNGSDGTGTNAVSAQMYAGSQTVDLNARTTTANTMPEAWAVFLEGSEPVPSITINATSENETVEIGFTGAVPNTSWAIFGELELEYLGASLEYAIGEPECSASYVQPGGELTITFPNCVSPNTNETPVLDTSKSITVGGTAVTDAVLTSTGLTSTVTFTVPTTIAQGAEVTVVVPAGLVAWSGTTVSSPAQDVTFTLHTPAIADQMGVYLMNTNTSEYLSRGYNWGTRADVDYYGIPVDIVSDEDGLYTIQYVDNSGYLGDTGWAYGDCGTDRWVHYTIESYNADGVTGYRFKCEEASTDGTARYLYLNENNTENDEENEPLVANNGLLNDNYTVESQAVWQIHDEAAHTAQKAAFVASQKAAIATLVGADDLDTYVASQTATDVTDFVEDPSFASAAIGGTSGWIGSYTHTENGNNGSFSAGGTDNNGFESWNGCIQLQQTITDLPSGVYKIDLNGFFRQATNIICYSYKDYDMSTAFIDANGYEINLKPWASEASLNSGATGTSASDYAPNSKDASYTACATGYANELYTYVGDDGTLVITIDNQGYAFDEWMYLREMSLTYYGDIEDDCDYEIGSEVTVGNIIYTVVSGNMFDNGGFNRGVTGWTAGSDYTDALTADKVTLTGTGGYNGGTYLTLPTSVGASNAATPTQAIEVTPGKTYLFVGYTSGATPTSGNLRYSALFEMDVNEEGKIAEKSHTEDGTSYSNTIIQLEWGADPETSTDEWTQTIGVFTVPTEEEESTYGTYSYVGMRMNWSTGSYDGFQLYEVQAPEETIEWEMTDAGWGTLILPFAADVPEGLTLYAGDALTLDSDGTTITVGDASETIAANTPYLVSGSAATYEFTGVATNTQDSYTVGMLTGTLVNMTQDDFTADSGQYVLQNHEDEGLAFYPITDESTGVTLDAYHCYLTSSSVSPMALHLPGMATGIVAVEGDVIANDAIYDLSGRRVSKAVKGVYIMNGKKVLVK